MAADAVRTGHVSSQLTPSKWARAVGRGLYRCTILVGLTAPVPATAVAVGYFGAVATLSWGWAGSGVAGGVRILAATGELLVALTWSALATSVVVSLVGRPLAQMARGRARRWQGTVVDASYRPVPKVSQMATGYWWNGFEYYRSEKEARHEALIRSRLRDPQVRRDVLWLAVASVAVLPVAAVPLAALGAGLYLLVGPSVLWAALVMIAVAAVTSPFAWRVDGHLAAWLLGPPPQVGLDRRLRELESVQADLTQAQAAELERIERDLHDGAQARLVALGMSLNTVERLIDSDPASAKAVLADARASSADALDELRRLVRGINPPVLAERGLVDALRALALDAPIPVRVGPVLDFRLERPVESAVYFAVAELITNAAKHARAAGVTVEMTAADGQLRVSVSDDGVGGAVMAVGSGLDGVRRRMASLGGRIDIESPTGGPTRIDLSLPCESS